MASAALVVFAIAAIGYILINAGGGYVDTSTGVGPRSSNSFVNALARAIAHAEGFYVPGARPARDHNPGDLSDSYLSVGKDGPLSIYPDDQAGWDALTFKLDNILQGRSNVYSPDMAIIDFAVTWTGGDNPSAWAANVAAKLGVSIDATLGDTNAGYVNA